METDPISFGNRVRERRLELRLSQTKLARAIGKSQQTITYIEAGKPKKGPEAYVYSLCMALQTSPEWLLTGQGPRSTGIYYLPTPELAEKYDALPVEGKVVVTQVVEEQESSEEPEKKSG